MKKNLFLFAVLFLLCFPAPASRAEDSLLKIEALPDQSIVKAGMMFLVHVRVVNSSSGSSTEFWGNTCSYEKHWVTDNSGVFIQSWTCNENTLEEITLSSGDAYEKSIILYVPKEDKTGPVTFRLGFKRMSEDGDVAEPLWSDPITMNVIVPEKTENADETSPATDSNANTAGTAGEEAKPEAPDSGIPAVSQPFVFQDPGVPIKIKPGQEFSISLTSNPSTGFRWKMALPEGDTTVTFLGSEHAVSEEVMPGAPGQEVFKFKAMTPGATNASFVYERPWETKTAPTRKDFTILVQEE